MKKNEVSESEVDVLIIDEATDMSMKPQMSTVLRYQYRNGNTEEIYRYQ
jgi:hypothetical protein